MNNDIKEIKLKIRKFLEKKDLTIESQFFLLDNMRDEIKNEILYEDEEDDQDFDLDMDFGEGDEKISEESSHSDEQLEEELIQPKQPPTLKKSSHSMQIAQKLKNKAVKNRLKIKKPKDDDLE